MTIRDALDDGWLVPIRPKMVRTSIDLSSVKAGADFDERELDAVMSAIGALIEIAEALCHFAGDRKTLVFCTSVRHAKQLTYMLEDRGKRAAFIDAKTPAWERGCRLADFEEGRVQFLCNVGIATEGFDVPSIECVGLARPTKSRALYAQMVGRGTRPCDSIAHDLNAVSDRHALIAGSEKPDLLLIDFTYNSGTHDLCGPADVLAGSCDDAVIAKANKRLDEGEEFDDALSAAEREHETEEEMRRRATIRATVEWSERPFDVFADAGVSNWDQRGKNHGRPATAKQAAALNRLGICTDNMTFNVARRLLADHAKRRKEGKADYRQMKQLKALGHDGRNMTAQEASRIIREAQYAWQ
jgi:superfamily II DNA or RNA helicase